MYRVELVTTEQELLDLKDRWSGLLVGVPRAPIFLTWEWVTSWWRHYGTDRGLWLLLAWDDAGDLVGLAPWMLERVCLGSRCLRRIAFIGSGIVAPDHLDVIARSGDGEAVCSAFLDHLNRSRSQWDLLELEGLAEDSMLRSCLAVGGGRYFERESIACPYISLPQDWETYEMSALSANRRQQLRRRLRQLERRHPGQVSFRRVTEAEEFSSAFDLLVELNLARWDDRGEATSFHQPHFAEFHRDFASLALKRDWLRLYELRVGDQVISMQYCFHYRDVFYDYQRGLDPDWNRYSPGHLLLAHAIQEAIEEGAGEFDLLRGVESYKFSWTDTVRSDSRILFSTEWPGHLWSLGTTLYDGAASVAKAILPDTAQRRIGQFMPRP